MWNNEIDEAARAFTAGEPSSDLKTRVLERIEGAAPSPRRALGWMWIALPAAVTILMVVVFRDRSPRLNERLPQEQAQEAQALPHVHAASRNAPARQIDQRVPPARLRNRAVPIRQMRAEGPAASLETESPFALPRLVVDPIAIAAIPAASPITIDDLSTSPIEIDDIDIPELTQ
jgi:hypothetical protein